MNLCTIPLAPFSFCLSDQYSIQTCQPGSWREDSVNEKVQPTKDSLSEEEGFVVLNCGDWGIFVTAAEPRPNLTAPKLRVWNSKCSCNFGSHW